MPNSYIEVTGANTVSVASLNYISATDLKAIGKDDADATWTTLVISVNDETKVATVTSGSTYDKVRVYRDTAITQLVDFQSGVRLTETDLDTAYQQGLFAAQEVKENAIEQNASTPNVSSVSGILPIAHGGTASTSTTYCSLTANVSGILPVTFGGTGINGDSGQVLEEFLLPCDGIAYTSRSGAYTPAAVTAAAALTDTHADVVGSSISYTPPAGTQIVIYKFITSLFSSSIGVAHFALWLDGVEVTDARTTIEFTDDAGRRTIEWALPIGGVANAATGRLASWSGAKIIKVQARRTSSDPDASLHATTSWDGSASAEFSRPLIGIKAIG